MRNDRQWQFGSMSSHLGMPPGVKWLIIANVALFVPYYLAAGTEWVQPFLLLALVPAAVLKHLAVWQLATYMFLHGGIGHLLFNMLALYFFGPSLEADWGTRRFLKFYFFCGMGAGVCDVLISALMGNWNTRTIGASGAIYGILLAFGLLYPNLTVLFMFLFPMKAKHMVMIYGAIAFLGALKVNTGISDVAHLGGMLFGYIFLRARAGFLDIGRYRAEYRTWKLRRAKRKFQVYMRKRRDEDDRWVN